MYKKILLLIIFISNFLLAQAPPYPEYLEKINKGLVPVPHVLSNPEYYENWELNWNKPSLKKKLLENGFYPEQTNALIGNINVLVVLVDFSDNPATKPATYFDDLVFDTTNANPWSVSNYYRSVSYNKIKIVAANKPSQIGWIRLSKTYSYYVGSDNGHTKSSEFVTDVLTAIDNQVDFKKYDNDGDGKIEGLIIVHAGPGAEVGVSNAIWSHAGWGTYIPAFDGVKVNRYSVCPEIYYGTKAVQPGVFCHELGHSLFNFIDVYDRHTNNSQGYQSQGLGNWSLMASGSYLGASSNDGSRPCRPDIYNILKMGTITPKDLTTSSKNIILKPINDTNLVYRIPYQLASSVNTYYLVEYRQKKGIDAQIPGEGVFIYKIDNFVADQNDYEWIPAPKNPAGHTNQGHYQVSLIQADGEYHLERSSSDGGNNGDAGDPYPGTKNVTEYTFNTFPSSIDYDGIKQTVNIRNIKINSNNTASFDLERDFLFSNSKIDYKNVAKTTNNTKTLNFKLANASGNLTSITDAKLLNTNSKFSFETNPSLPSNLLNNKYFELNIKLNTNDTGAFSDTLSLTVANKTFKIPVIANVVELNKAETNQIYVVSTASTPSKIYKLNSSNASSTLAATFPTNYDLPVITINPVTKEFFGFVNYQDIYRYDLSQNQFYYEGSLSEKINAATFDLNGNIYAVTQSGKFLQVNPYNAQSNVISTKTIPYQSICYDVNSGKFYTTLNSTNNDIKNAIYEITATNGDTVRIATTNKNKIIGGIAADGYGNLFLIPTPEGLKYAGLYKFNITNKTIDSLGNTNLRNLRSIAFVPQNITSVYDFANNIPQTYNLYQNYPNPFNPTTTIQFSIPERTNVKLSIFDVLGREIQTIVNDELSAGTYKFNFNANYLSSGIYFYRIDAGKFSSVKKMILMK